MTAYLPTTSVLFPLHTNSCSPTPTLAHQQQHPRHQQQRPLCHLHPTRAAAPPRGMQQQQQAAAMYDFVLALNRLQEKIQALSALKQQSSAPATHLGASWSFLKANRGNMLLLMTFYSMSTASIMGCGMSERRLQSDRLLEGKEQEDLQRQIHRLERQVQQQQQVLDNLAGDLQQHSSGSSGSSGWWRAAAVRQQMLQRLQEWRDTIQGVRHETRAQEVSSSSRTAARGTRSKEQQPEQQTESVGVKIGPLGKGFLI